MVSEPNGEENELRRGGSEDIRSLGDVVKVVAGMFEGMMSRGCTRCNEETPHIASGLIHPVEQRQARRGYER